MYPEEMQLFFKSCLNILFQVIKLFHRNFQSENIYTVDIVNLLTNDVAETYAFSYINDVM